MFTSHFKNCIMKKNLVLKKALLLMLPASLFLLTNATAQTTKPGPIGVCYVEVNGNNLVNTGCYTLKNGGQQLFDIAVIFAANINYDVANRKAVLFNNSQVSTLLSNKNLFIKPLQDKGIKVTLSLLGNHQGAGICNFTSRAAAKAFAKTISDTISFYGLDGVDFDDEYADYGNNGTGQPNDSSFVMLVSELRKLMPNKLITFYYFGPATTRLSYKGQRIGDLVNYSWNAIYDTYSAPNVPGLSKSQLSAAAVKINSTSAATAKQLAQRTKTDGYGVFLCYDLHGNDESTYLSSFSNALYNSDTKLAANCLQPWPPVITGCTRAFEPNETQATAKTIALGTTNTAAITTATDVDYFKVVATTTSKNVYTLIGPAGKDYDLFVYNSAGTQIGVSESPTPNETVTLTNQAAGTYYIKVIGYGGANTTACYSLKVSNNNALNALKTDVMELPPLTTNTFVENKTDDINISPNPATDKVSLFIAAASNANVLLQIVNTKGTIVLSNSLPMQTGKNKIAIDVHTLLTGMYYAILNVDGKTITKKLIITK